jgi:hypothetical protein
MRNLLVTSFLSTASTARGVVISRYVRDGTLEQGALGPETGNW